jgi:hypothetical protein
MSPHVVLPDHRASIKAPVRDAAWRRVAALVLHGASLALASAAQRLVAAQAAATAEPHRNDLPRIEFHAEAGALEGALYVDGQFIGTLPGVTRL